jgi:uncharacterized surface protein with fasciclin (FAS1) repeats
MDGFVDTSSMDDDAMLPTRNGGKVRISMYNTHPRTVMANCAKIVSRDHMATNGVVHMVDKVGNEI